MQKTARTSSLTNTHSDTLYSMCQVPHVVSSSINSFPKITAFQRKIAFSVFRYTACYKMVTMVTTRNITVVFQFCQTIHP